jgi:hypothetical protein
MTYLSINLNAGEQLRLQQLGRYTIFRDLAQSKPAGLIQTAVRISEPGVWQWVGLTPAGVGPTLLGDPFTCPYGPNGWRIPLMATGSYNELPSGLMPSTAEIESAQPARWLQLCWEINLRLCHFVRK